MIWLFSRTSQCRTARVRPIIPVVSRYAADFTNRRKCNEIATKDAVTSERIQRPTKTKFVEEWFELRKNTAINDVMVLGICHGNIHQCSKVPNNYFALAIDLFDRSCK